MGLIICKTKDQILTNFKIRFEVFNKEQNVPYELDMDLAEFNGEMFLYADENEEYVACARMIYEENRAHIGRIATLKEYRGRGYATKMISSLEKVAQTLGYHEVYIEAQLDKLDFYEKLGYVAYGDIFMDANMEHTYMRKKI